MNKHHQVTQAHHYEKRRAAILPALVYQLRQQCIQTRRQHYRYFNTHLPATNHRVLPLEIEGRYPCI